MHPKNVYRNGISFTQLAKEHPSFAKCLKGGSSINFHDPESVRQLAKALLKKDFNLEIELPEDRLCPAYADIQADTLHDRLNYILWVADLLTDTHESKAPSTPSPEAPRITGIDIGTGASAIYPLLGCASYPHWHFIATENDATSLSHASKNVANNLLERRIKIVDASSSSSILPTADIAASATPLDFTMCNPPFYASVNDMLASAKLKAVPPLSACTGSTTEMVTDGGEVAFVSRMVDESIALQGKVRWYTSMLGKLSSVEKVIDKLKECGIVNYVVGEFVQGVGKTKRWAVGWSFGERRAGDHISRQPTTHSLKSHLPFPTTFRIQLPADAALSTFLPQVEALVKDSCTDFPAENFNWNSIRLPCFATMYGAVENLYSNGCGETTGNTWSRAARRRRKKATTEGVDVEAAEVEPKFGFAVGIFIGAGGRGSPPSSSMKVKTSSADEAKDNEKGKETEKETAVENDAWDHDFISLPASSVEIESSKGSYVLVRRTRGVDQVVWESFCGMLRRKIVEGLPKLKT
ncbi:Psilocybin synthase [Drechslerella dactyloides]|uniref:Psilocybin synthase n=1 Tax=Drechslerella dactyloides TaxID=74499 RepID=A0AAD6NG81_DREDA|nr:Psilocybin synthase [Drechslerella dactyloides]